MAVGAYIDDREATGTSFGQSSTDKITFYGGTPQARAAFTNAAVSAAVAVTTGTLCSTWGFTSSTQANAVVALANEIRAQLVALNLVATS